ncbi:hypothetical protein PGH45_09105 [Legionella pneumophila]|uniref:hypothetical protein n=1 Tax=Legionella pneumophila TaxID=446 RepID=UPI0020BEA664|nr:hypothetical protein [Legionella pneumophila]MDF1930184.1 hypothetical protein [Legionella pneumophila]
MTKKHLSTFEREMQDPIFREQFEQEYQDDVEKWQQNHEKTNLKSKNIGNCNSKIHSTNKKM